MIIVSLTTWKPRFGNIPAVLDSIFAQTVVPDKVVINLADEEELTPELDSYLSGHGVEVFRVPDTKVYKKLVPTLRRYPEAEVISIDDDWLYPPTMIEDFIKVHQAHPLSPVSGNRESYAGLNCHCGCASLTKAEFFGRYLDLIDSDLMANCASDDIAYTYLAAKNGHYYIRTDGLYYDNLQPVDQTSAYSPRFSNPVVESFEYVSSRFGSLNGTDKALSAEEYRLRHSESGKGSGKRLAVVFNASYGYAIPYFLRRMANINGCVWDLFVTSLSEDSPKASLIREMVPDARFVPGDWSINGLGGLGELAAKGELSSYDAVLHLNTLRSIHCHVMNYMHMKYPAMVGDIVNPLIGTERQFAFALCKLDRYQAVCSDACYSFSDRIDYFPEESKALQVSGRYPSGSNFLCRTDALGASAPASLPEDPDARERIETARERLSLKQGISIFRVKSFAPALKRFAHLIFSAHTYTLPIRKVIFLFGMPIVRR